GVSADGWLAGMALLDPHPALKAVSPQGTAADMWMGDDFFHYGAFRLSYGHEMVAMMENGKEDADVKVGKYDTYDWYLKLGPLSNITDKLPQGKYPTWQSFVTHPAYDQFWQSRSMHRYLTDISVPTMNVAGWWDQEDFYGPMKAYEVQEKNDARGLNFLVVGPWNHGGWTQGNGDKLGKIEFKSVTAKYFREQIQAPFFAHYLKGKGDFKIVANLFASTSGSDSDWVVKLIDVYPEEYPDNPKMGGYQLMIAGEAMRGRYHRSFEKPEPLVPNKVTEFVFSIRPHDHRFLKGHKIMVQVQSTWFPVIDRNPQKYVENIFKARDADYQAATQHIYRSKRFPSHLKLPIVTTTSSASESK